MSFELQTLYEQIDTYGEFIGAQDVRNKNGKLIMQIVNIEFDNNLFIFFNEWNKKDECFKPTKLEIKKL